MDYKEKYEQAINFIKDLYPHTSDYVKEKLDDFFPELKESEDERMKKSIIQTLKKYSKCVEDGNDSPSAKDFLVKDIENQIAWLEKQGTPTDINPSEFDLRLNKLLKQFETLPKEELANSLSFYLNVVQNDGIYKPDEKQGEQKPADTCDSSTINSKEFPAGEKRDFGYFSKPADNVEPKFHIGDYVVDNCGYVWKIEGILNQFYILEGIEGGELRPIIEWVNKTFHFWTIQDAKDGDILQSNNKPFIYNEYLKEGKYPFGYGGINLYGRFGVSNGLLPMTHDEVTPATKEQRDLLFQKMKEAGYEWDENNKMLKEIVEDEEESQNYKNQVMSEITDLVKHYIKQKPTCNETGEESLGIDSETYNKIVDECIYGEQKSQRMVSAEAKEAMYDKPACAWSEEDESWFKELELMALSFSNDVSYLEKFFDWLKSLKDKYTWKPSISQLNALSIVSKGNAPDDIEAIVSLYNDLKKLTE